MAASFSPKEFILSPEGGCSIGIIIYVLQYRNKEYTVKSGVPLLHAETITDWPENVASGAIMSSHSLAMP